MAGLFRKRQFKPWIVSCISAQDRHFKSKVVKVLCRRSNDRPGCIVMLVSDGELSISAAFSEEAVDNALSNIGLDRGTRWDNAFVILHEFKLELNLKKGEYSGEYFLYVEKFSIWDLQPGYTAKFDIKYCMENKTVSEKMAEEIKEIKERAVNESECNNTGSIGLSQLLDQMGNPSESLSQASGKNVENESNRCTDKNGVTLTESLMEKLLQPFSVNEFLIPESQLQILQNIPEWQPDYQPEGETPISSDQQFDVCAANTLSSPPDNAVKQSKCSENKKGREFGQSVFYLGIFISSQEEKVDKVEVKTERQSPEPVNALFKCCNKHSLTQGTSSQWQEELESLRFSFEDSNLSSTQQDEVNLTNEIHSRTSVQLSQDNINHHANNVCVDKSNKDVVTIDTNSQEIYDDKSSKDVVGMDRNNQELCHKSSKDVVGMERNNQELCHKSSKGVVAMDTNNHEISDNHEICDDKSNKDVVASEKNNHEKSDMSNKDVVAMEASNHEISDKSNNDVVALETDNHEESDKVNKDEQTFEKDEQTEEVTEYYLKENEERITIDKDGQDNNRLYNTDSSRTGSCMGEKEWKDKQCVSVRGNDKENSKEVSDGTEGNTVTDMTVCFDLGSPNAQSTQINRIENKEVRGKDTAGDTCTEVAFKSTEENESQRQCETNFDEKQINTQEDSVSQNLDNDKSSQDCVNNESTINDGSSMLVQCFSIKSEIDNEIETSQRSDSCNCSVSDKDKSVMLDYYSGSSSSTSTTSEHNWHKMLVKLNDKRRKLVALKYLADRVSAETDRNDLSVGMSKESRSENIKKNVIKCEDFSNIGDNVVGNLSKDINMREGADSNHNKSLICSSAYSLLSEVKIEPVETNTQNQTEIRTMNSSECGYPLVSSSGGKTLSSKESCASRGNKYNKINKYSKSRKVVLGEKHRQSDVHQENHSGLLLKNKQNDRQQNKQNDRQQNKQSDRQQSKQSDRQQDKQSDMQQNKQSDRQQNKQSDRQQNKQNYSTTVNEKGVRARLKNDCMASDQSSSAAVVNDKLHQKTSVMRDFNTAKLKYMRVASNHHKKSVISKSKGENMTQGTQKYGKWTKIDDNIFKRISETNHIEWKFKKSIIIRLERCDEKESCHKEKSNNNIPSNCESGTASENVLHRSVNDSDAEIHEQRVNESCSDKEAKRSSYIVKNDEQMNEESALKGSDKTVRIPFSGYELTADDKIEHAKEDNYLCISRPSSDWAVTNTNYSIGKKSEIILSLRKNYKPVDKLLEKSNKEIEGQDKTDHNYCDKDKNNVEVPKETDSEMNVNKRNVNDISRSKSATNCVSNHNTEHIKATGSAEDESCYLDNRGQKRTESYQIVFSNIFTSPLQGTQPFEVSKFPETQEFVPESPTKFKNESFEWSISGDSAESSIIPHTGQFVPTLSESLDHTASNHENFFSGINLSENIDDTSIVPLSGKSNNNISENGKQSKISICGTNLSEKSDKAVGVPILEKNVSNKYESSKHLEKCSPTVNLFGNSDKISEVQNQGKSRNRLCESSEKMEKLIPRINLSDISDRTLEITFPYGSIQDICQSTQHLDKDLSKSFQGNQVQKLNIMIGKSSNKELNIVNERENMKNGEEKVEEVTPVTRNAETFKPSVDNDNVEVDEVNSKDLYKPADNKVFTKLITKSVHQKLSNAACSIISQRKTLFRVKPYGKMVLQKKRTICDDDDYNDKTSRKKNKFIKEDFTSTYENESYAGVKLKEGIHTVSSVIGMLDSTDSSSVEDFMIKAPTKKPKTDQINDKKYSKDKDSGNIHVARLRETVRKPCKTYEPRKIYIDGNCFGNKVFWQNYMESPYSTIGSCEKKTISYNEKTNKRKSSLDSSQGSEKKEICEIGKTRQSAAINRSSESLFSAENNEDCKGNSSPDSVSLLPTKKQAVCSNIRTKAIVKRQSDQTKLKEPVKVLNDKEQKGTNSDLFYRRSDGVLRFFRQATVDNNPNIKDKVSENSRKLCVQEGKQKKHDYENDNNSKKLLFEHNAQDVQKDKCTLNRENTKVNDICCSNKQGRNRSSNLINVEAVDKNLFIQDWLMKHKKIGEQSKLSPADSVSLEGSLPSYQPVNVGCQQPCDAVMNNEKPFCVSAGLDEEQQGKDNSICDVQQQGKNNSLCDEEQQGKDYSSCDSSSADISSVNSEELKKPMSAAARYLLKFKKARREKRKREMNKRKSERRPTKLI